MTQLPIDLMTAFHYNLAVLHTACDSDPGIVAERKKGFPGLHFTISLDEMLKNPDIKAMAISPPQP